MKKYAMITYPTGNVDYIVSPASSNSYADGSWYGEHVAMEIDASEPNDLFMALNYWNLNTNEWCIREARPSPQHVWTAYEWVVPAISTEELWETVRFQRAMRLGQTDWTQVADSPLADTDKAAWATYRQALRDVPANNPNITGLEDVTWPTEPGA